MSTLSEDARDVMMVCRNGHIITDRMRSQPEQMRTHCDRCGAGTVFACATCGTELPGAVALPGLATVGKRQPPLYCSICGAAFPWTRKQIPLPPEGLLPILEMFLRRLPRCLRQLRLLGIAAPDFCWEDERELDALLRSTLPLCCDDLRLDSRTPRYASRNQTDYLLLPDRIALTAKLVTAAGCEDQLHDQLIEDVVYHRQHHKGKLLVAFFCDAQGLLHDPRTLESQWSGPFEGLDLRCVIAT
jgi:hypothetical protein